MSGHISASCLLCLRPRNADSHSEVLEAKGIAWPNPYIGLAHHGGRLSHPVGFANRHGPVTHSDVAHMNDACHPPGAVPRPAYQPVDSPLQAYNQAAAAKHDGDGSRSSSQYSVVPDSARPLFSRDLFTQTYPAHAVDPARKAGQMAVRLPSDQLQMLLHAINPVHQQPGTISAVQMPPPPLPAHAISARQDGASHQRFGSSGAVERPPLADTVHVVDRRGDSRYSDVSMHAGCTSFPTCTTIDSDGHVEHTAAAPPATMVKGKKEGSASTKRKSSSKHEANTNIDHAEKKVRRSSRLLQHDSGYDGGSSDDRASGHANVEADGSAGVEQPSGHAQQEED